MAFVAASTHAGTRKQVNEDACCIEVAATPLGEVLMAVVCDGVGGLAKGNVASATVIDRFVGWFERDLPALLEGMVAAGRFDFPLVRIVWETQLQALNDLIRTHGITTGARLGTTFTGLIACSGHYLIGHVGDCRAYRMNAGGFAQLTEDQTQVAKRLAAGEITAEEARRAPKNVILQAVGSQRLLNPVFTEGSFGPDDLFVICCDGAYHRAENEGIQKLFQGLDYRNEGTLQEACDTLLQFDMDCGEKDNLTVVCFSGALGAAGEVLDAGPQATPADEDDLATMVESAADEDDLATMVDSGDADEDDLSTMVADEPVADSDEDELVTMVADESDADSGEDDLATMVEPAADEEDLATMVADEPDADSDEDDLATMVEPAADEDDLVTMVTDDSEPEDEDDLATMVAGDDDSDEDDLATMVAGDEPPAASVDLNALLRELAARLSTTDEDGLATVVVADDDDLDDDDDFGLPTFGDDDDDDDDLPHWSSDEDDLPTMVDGDPDDDLPTMVEGDDA